MSFFQWAMRRGALILFVTALLIFTINFAIYFFLQVDAYGQASGVTGRTESKFILFWAAVTQALEFSVWSFLGACLLYRVDLNRKASKE